MEHGATEYILREQPFTVRRIVKWSECDPAGMLLTANIFHYAGSANSMFLSFLHGGPRSVDEMLLGTSFPNKALSFVFHRPLVPHDIFDMRVTISKVGVSTFESEIRAVDLDQRLHFVAKITKICIDPGDRKRVEIPTRLREAILQYQIAAQSP